MSKGKEAFDALPPEQKLDILWPRISIMLKMIKDTKMNYDKFLIPKGAVNKDAVTYVEFMKGYKLLFPHEFQDENN